jgi:hypothetical protein
MKRILVCAAVAAALAIPAGALGAQAVFFGALDDQPDASVKVKTGTNDGGSFVRLFTVRSYEVSCAGGETAVVKRSSLSGQIPIGSRRTFHARDDDGQTVFNVRGRIGRNKAQGSFRLSGQAPITTEETADCDSGRQTWTAR